ncbi:hypothetical protein TPL01_07450 [Sulfuriferula plumbiphila]|uniref:Uncharacterized protein n=1 Tax=Sulfuriferula plumbiphila TaxID=171865 RepID=A0A512L533_9PROT|nr:hypothetical protein TPL01_07450 [Sulfuriferula plumbiphila]
MRTGWVQAGLGCQLFQAEGFGVVGQYVQQLHHAVDDLNRRSGFNFAQLSFPLKPNTVASLLQHMKYGIIMQKIFPVAK